MAIFASVTSNSITTNFLSFGSAAPRYFIDLVPSGSVYDNKHFHAPGWNGNAIIRGGFTGQQLALIVQYRSTLSLANDAWKTDRDSWAKYNCIVNKAVVGETPWSRCTLLSSDRITDEMANGADGTKWFNVRFLFQVEEQY